MAPIRAVVFDVYGTLFYNQQSSWEQTFARITREQHLSADPVKLFAAWRAIDRKFRERRVDYQTMTQVLPFETYTAAWRASLSQTFKDLNLPGDAQRGVSLFLEGMATRAIYPDVRPMLNALRGAYTLAALSNADTSYFTTLLEASGLRKEFAAVLSSEEAQAYKPVPAIFLTMLKKLGVPASETAYMGDTPLEDVLGPKKVGMRAVRLNRDSTARAAGDPTPDAEIRTLAELPQVLIELDKRPATHTVKA